MTIQKPNINQSTDDSLAGKMKDSLHKWLMTVDDMLPARVVAYDDSSGLATVQPLVMVGTTDGTKISRAPVAGIKTLRIGAGGFFIRFPIKPGDLGWIKANDRDISLILQSSGGEDWPNTKRLHSFSDALFIPDTYKQWAIDGADIDSLIIQSMDGSVKIALRSNEIEIKAQTVKINGDLELTGNISATGDVEFTGPSLKHNNINVGSTHNHSGVVSGSDNTGTPNP